MTHAREAGGAGQDPEPIEPEAEPLERPNPSALCALAYTLYVRRASATPCYVGTCAHALCSTDTRMQVSLYT